jgi:diguanylate cyclase (GGDEF)-like protein/PAS domain S-box-containing protein
MDSGISRRLVAALVTVCVILFANTVFSYSNVSRLVAEERQVEHTLLVREKLQALLTSVLDAETSQRGYAITGGEPFLAQFEQALERLPVIEAEIMRLFEGQERQRRFMVQHSHAVADKIDWMRLIVAESSRGAVDRALELIASGRGAELMEAVYESHEVLAREEDRMLKLRRATAETTLRMTIIGLIAFAAASLLLIALIFHFLRRDIAVRRRAEQALHSANQMLRLVLDHIPQRIFWKEANFRYLGANRLTALDAGLASPNELVGKTDFELPWRKQAPHYQADDEQVLAAGRPKLDYEEPQTRADGSERYLRTNKVPLRDLQGQVIGVLGTYEDITEQKAAQRRLRLQASAIEASSNGILITRTQDGRQAIEYVNPAFEAITGYRGDEVIDSDCSFLQGDDRKQPVLAELRAALSEQRSCRVTLRNYRKDGTLFWNDLQIAPVHDEAGEVTHYVGIINDITERVAHVDHLQYLANTDLVTGLPNRNRLVAAMSEQLARGDTGGFSVAVLDLDHFKFLNDSLGYAFGDALLRETGARLRGLLGPEHLVAKLGEDEFGLLLVCCDEDEVAGMVEHVRQAVGLPVQLSGREVRISCSIGVSVFPQDGADSETLLRQADLAMYRAKEEGRNTARRFGSDMTHRADERQQFLLHYQPQVDLANGRVFGAEALIRWQHPEQGMISPARFMPLAEDSDLILSIGDWVLRSACAQARAWQDEGMPPLVVSVNVSLRQFRHGGFADRVLQVLEETGLAPQWLELELTESVLMHDVTALLEVLERFRRAGIGIAVDDFGTGYSSLSYLKRLPLDKLKIDQSFVRDIPHDQNDMAIARTVIALARSLDLKVIAEGVETAEQLEFLRTNGCDQIQGYYFSRPVDAAAFAELLRTGRSL